MPNTKYLQPIGGYRRQLMKDIEEAEWMYEDARAESLQRELDYVTDEIKRGSTMMPMF
jgi:hypothetical protein